MVVLDWRLTLLGTAAIAGGALAWGGFQVVDRLPRVATPVPLEVDLPNRAGSETVAVLGPEPNDLVAPEPNEAEADNADDPAVPQEVAAVTVVPVPNPPPPPPGVLRLIVTDIAFEPEFIRLASRLPSAVAFGLPSTHPERDSLLEGWQASGREVLVRVHMDTALDDETPADEPEDAWSLIRREVERGTLADGVLVTGAQSIDDGMRAALATAAGAWRTPVLLVTEPAETGMVVWLDAHSLGRDGFATALDDIEARLQAGDDVRLALPFYPGIAAPIEAWLATLDGDNVILQAFGEPQERSHGG